MNIDQPQTTSPQINQPVVADTKPLKRQRRRCIALCSGLLLAVGTVLAALHFLSPTIPGRAETLPARVTWYLTQGQWRPDSRTFAAAWDYFLRTENEMPTESSIDNGPVAATPTETTLPKS